MSAFAEIARRLVDAGASIEEVGELVARAAAEAASDAPTARQARNRRYYEKRLKPSESVSKRLNSDATKTPSKVPPNTPLITSPSDPIGSASDAEKGLFKRGKQVLGESAGGLIAKLLKAKGRDIALARAAIETASTKQNPAEYIGGVIRGAEKPDANDWRSAIV